MLAFGVTCFYPIESAPIQTPVIPEVRITEDVIPVEETILEKQPELLPDGTDLNRLAYAVAMAETKDCTTGIGPKKLNCFGIKGKDGYMKTYASKEESYADFKRIWSTYYKKYPDWNLAKKWSGNDSVQTWLNSINQYYDLR